MKYSQLKGKSLAECKGFEKSEKMFYSKENHYPYIRMRKAGSEESLLVLLSRGLAADLQARGTNYPPLDSVFHVYVDEESGEERIKLGRPATVYIDATIASDWG